MLELQKFELGQDEETLRRAEETRRGNLGPVVEIDGIVLDRLLILVREILKQKRHDLSERIIDVLDDLEEQAAYSSEA